MRGIQLGAQEGLQGQIKGGELNLKTQLGFGAGEDDHSGQFNWNIQRLGLFYIQLRLNLFPQ